MIAQLRGQVVSRQAGRVVVDVGGVGYLVHVATGTTLPPPGEPVELHTSLQVREDSMTLYGFPDAAALALFELLLGSSGVGPKLALAALGTHRPDVLRAAIATGDVATLTAIPGVGRKVADRLVLELRDKVGGDDLDVVAPAGDHGPAGEVLSEVRAALLGLGYSTAEANRALTSAGAGSVEDPTDTSALLRQALRHLAGDRAG